MEAKENETLPYLEIGREYFYNPVYKSELKIMNITLRLEKKFNWLNRIMFKLFFGIEVTNIRK